ncbi:MAG TPA: methylated-DNA--[protein]-cysteine S-methyltransferase [Gemmatimonadaceae bacterium]|nr:methylated-DNA--[protein]-cysteine S-methyltransferase [Gemmatimonadaceae bacterium]
MDTVVHATGDIGIALFATAIGECAIAWNDAAITGVQLPERTPRATRARMARRFPDARELVPPPRVRAAIDGMRALLAGEPRDLSGVPLDMRGVPSFNQRVYEIARTVAPGDTITYGELAAKLGDPAAARDVGRALGENPFPIVVPCHRVLAAGGRAGGFSGGAGVATKLRMLAIERSPGPLFDQPGSS